MIRKIILSKFIVFISCSLFAQDLDTAKLNKYFNTLEENSKVMGSVAVAKKGDIIYRKSIGFANVEQQIEADAKTTYGIGSISKTFTATLVMMAVEEGEIKLHDQLSEYFPNIINAEKISLENLLQHRSGIPNFTDDSTYLNWNEVKKSREEMLEFIASFGSNFQPDSISQYSNSNYVLLSYILEDIYNKPYADLLEEKIAEHLNLENTYLFNAKNPGKNESSSYHYKGKWEKSGKTHPSITLGAGGIFSTPTDLVKFSYGLFAAHLISQKQLDTMTNSNEKYGLGLFQIPFYDMKGYGHTGGVDGYSSVFAFFPHDSISYAFISNGSNYMVNNISIAVLSAIYGKEYEIPEFSKYEVGTEILQQYVGNYSSEQIPLKINISLKGDQLFAQASGQSSFPLSPKAEHVFIFEPVDVEMIFKPEGKSFVLKQFGQEYNFVIVE